VFANGAVLKPDHSEPDGVERPERDPLGGELVTLAAAYEHALTAQPSAEAPRKRPQHGHEHREDNQIYRQGMGRDGWHPIFTYVLPSETTQRHRS
jgi:hypothetical protein